MFIFARSWHAGVGALAFVEKDAPLPNFLSLVDMGRRSISELHSSSHSHSIPPPCHLPSPSLADPPSPRLSITEGPAEQLILPHPADSPLPCSPFHGRRTLAESCRVLWHAHAHTQADACTETNKRSSSHRRTDSSSCAHRHCPTRQFAKTFGDCFQSPAPRGAFWFPAMEEGTHFAFPLRVHRFEFSVHMGDKMARLVICCVDSCNSLPPRPTPPPPLNCMPLPVLVTRLRLTQTEKEGVESPVQKVSGYTIPTRAAPTHTTHGSCCAAFLILSRLIRDRPGWAVCELTQFDSKLSDGSLGSIEIGRVMDDLLAYFTDHLCN